MIPASGAGGPEFESRNGPSFVLLVALQYLLLLQAITILKEYNSESNILSCRAQGQEREVFALFGCIAICISCREQER